METEILAATRSTGTTPCAARTLLRSMTVATLRPSMTKDDCVRFASKFVAMATFFNVESLRSGSASTSMFSGRLTITYTSQSLYGYLKRVFLISSSLAFTVIVCWSCLFRLVTCPLLAGSFSVLESVPSLG